MDMEEKFEKPEEQLDEREELEEQLHRLEELVYDADALIEILHEILNANKENKGMGKLCYLSELIRKKFKEIRAVF